MATIAGRIAEGQFTGELQPRSARDAMGQAFVRMLAYLREAADAAARIAEGDLRGEIKPTGEGDTLGRSMQRMSSHLKDMIARLREASDQVAQTSASIATGAE